MTDNDLVRYLDKLIGNSILQKRKHPEGINNSIPHEYSL